MHGLSSIGIGVIIVGIILLVIGIILYEVRARNNNNVDWWIWALIITGAIMLILGIVLFAIGHSKDIDKTSVKKTTTVQSVDSSNDPDNLNNSDTSQVKRVETTHERRFE